MPSKVDGPYTDTRTTTYYNYQWPVVLMGSKYVCGCIPTVTGPFTDTTKSISSYYHTRNWNNSVPWPNTLPLKAVNAYTDRKETFKAPIVGYTHNNGGAVCGSTGLCLNKRVGMIHSNGFHGDGALNVAATLDTSDLLFVRQRAILAGLLKIKDQKGMVGVTLAERHKTFEMLTSRVHDLIRLKKGFLKQLTGIERRLGKKKLSKEKVHSLWLEYRYGWTPLLYEIKGYAEFINESSCSRTFPFRAKAEKDNDYSVQGYWNGAIWKSNYLETQVTKTTARCGGYFVIDNQAARDMSRLGLTNPLETVWEIIPYSFCVDWLVSVGDYIEASTATMGISLQSCWLSSVVQTKKQRTHVSDGDNGPSYYVYDSPPYQQWIVRQYDRTPWTPSFRDIDLASLVNVRMNTKRYLDAVALLYNLFSKWR